MKRTLLTLILCLCLVSSLILTVSAADSLPLVIDNAALMSAGETDALEQQAKVLSGTYEMDIVILTVPDIGSDSSEQYADNYYYEHRYGQGDTFSGILFLLSMEEQDWYIYTCGDAVYALTDYGIQESAAEALPSLSSGDYYNGFSAWLDVLEIYLDAYQNGSSSDGIADYSGSHYQGSQESVIHAEYKKSSPSLLTAMIIGLLVAGGALFLMVSAMNSKQPRNSAGSYMREGSFRMGIYRDIFLYSNVTKTPKPQNTSSRGGSSVSQRSGGRRHGGGGGKF